MSTDLSGQTLGEFELLERLGSGKFADVYRANWPARRRQVALKVFKDSLADASKGVTLDLVSLARDEARRSFSLDHPNIVKGYGLYDVGEHSLMIMDLVDGPTLYDLLAARRPAAPGEFGTAAPSGPSAIGDETVFDPGLRDSQLVGREETVVHSDEESDRPDAGPLGPARLPTKVVSAGEAAPVDAPRHTPLALGYVATIANDLCEALDYAHGRGVVHRDLKPENIFIAWNGVTLLGDFGVALAQEASSLMRTGMIIGTVHYMSPEQAKGLRKIDGRSDIYSLGVVLYHMLTGTLPFEGALLTLLDAHQRQTPERPSLRRGDIPLALEQVVLKCLAKEPKDRYASAHDLAAAIKRAVAPLPLTDLPELVAHARSKRPSSAPGSEKQLRQEAAGYCSSCGSPLTADEAASSCGACYRVLKPGEAAGEAKRLATDAAAFAASFKLDAVTDWGVLEWEYRRTIRPALEPKLQDVAATWAKLLDAGSVVPPQWNYIAQPRDSRLLPAAKQLFNLICLWNATSVDRFLVHDDFVKERTRRTAELRGQAYQLLGLHHCAVAAASTTHADTVRGYTAARHWFGKAAEDLANVAADLSAAATFAAGLTQVILDYPDQPRAADALTAPVIPVKAGGRQISGLATDLQVLTSYRGADERSRTRLRGGEANVARLLEKGDAALADREATLQDLADRARAERARVDAHCTEINDAYRRDLGLFAGLGIAARIGVVVGPLLVLLLASFLIWTIKGNAPMLMAAVLAAGALSLPLGAGYLGGKLLSRPDVDRYDISPVVAGVLSLWALVAFTLWCYGVTQPAAVGLLTGKTIGWAVGILVALACMWALVIWGSGNELGGRLWYTFITAVVLATIGLVVGYGIALSHWLPGHFLWLLGGTALLALLGWTAAHTVSVIRHTRTLAQGRRNALLRMLDAESETALRVVETELTSKVESCRDVTKELTGKIAAEIASLETEAQALSARLLCRSAPGELTPLDLVRQNAANLNSAGADAAIDRLVAVRSPISHARSQLAAQIKRLPVTDGEAMAAKASQGPGERAEGEKVAGAQAEAELRRLTAWAAPTVVLLLGSVAWGIAGVHYIPRRAELPPPVPFWTIRSADTPEPISALPLQGPRAVPSLTATATRAAGATPTAAATAATATSAAASRSVTPRPPTATATLPPSTPAPRFVARTVKTVGNWFAGTYRRLSRSPAVTRAAAWFEGMKVRLGLARATPTPATAPAPGSAAPTTAAPKQTAAPFGTSVSNDAASSKVVAIVNVRGANVRGGPGTNYPASSIAITGTQTTVIGRNPAGDWWYVCCVGGKQVWLANSVVRIEGSPADVKAVPTVVVPAP